MSRRCCTQNLMEIISAGMDIVAPTSYPQIVNVKKEFNSYV